MTEVGLPCSSMEMLAEMIMRFRNRNSFEMSPVTERRVNPFNMLHDTVRSLVANYGITSTQILEYLNEMEEMSSLPSNNRRGRVTDPRELPRPQKCIFPDIYPVTRRRRSMKKNNNVPLAQCQCQCHNCNELTLGLAECAICLEVICSQRTKACLCVTSCQECGNIACGRCAAKLHKCPYCRSLPGLVPNYALQRLINKLEMPCRDISCSRLVAKAELEFEMQPLSTNTSQSRILCLHKNCQWIGDLEELVKHMADSHSCIVFEGSSVSLVISDFKLKSKLSLVQPRNYCLILSYLSDIFVCKITLIGTKLKFVLVSVSRVEITDYGLSVEIGCNKKAITGIIPFSKKRATVSICTASLLSLMRKKSNAVTIFLKISPLS